MKKHRVFSFFITAILLLGLVSSSAPAPAVSAAKAQPQLIQFAMEQPDAQVRVIVQKTAGATSTEKRVAALGGTVTQDLRIINAFAAEMTAEAAVELARSDAVRWVSLDAPTVHPSADIKTILDLFSTVSYSGNNGTVNWSGNWSESGETTRPTGGNILVRTGDAQCVSSSTCVRMTASSSRSIYRQANLGTADSATLTFNYSRNASGGTVAVQISSNGGTSWTTLQSYTLNTVQNKQNASFNILAYKSSNTRLRFNVITTGSGMFWFDDVQITYTVPPAIPTTNTFLDTLGVQNIWNMGLHGDGISVAVIDSGISKDTDFSGDTSNNLMYSMTASSVPIDANGGRILRQLSFNPNSTTVNDIYGHGTHVAGIIGGGGDDSGGVFAGVAPLVNLLSLKVNDGNGQAYESDVVAALQWVYDNKAAYNIHVVNLSLNTTTEQSYNTSPLDAACEILWFNGVVVVASAGNKGPAGSYNTANASPANDPFIITVGASDERGTSARADDNVGSYSAFGTTSNGFAKPDIIAPGTNIYSVLSKSSSWGADYPDRTMLNGEYFRLSGTSMAAPIVTGAVALLLQDEPNLTPDQVKYRLTHSGSTIVGSSSDTRTYPYLDVYAVVTGTTTQSANTGLYASQLLSTGSEPIAWNSVGWNSVGWNSVGWNSVGWNSVGWNSVGWNSTFWGQ